MNKLLRNLDLFATSQFTLYRTKEVYGTAAGGLVSLLILGGLMFIFVSMAIDTFRYNTIYVTSQTIIDSNPLKYKVTTGAKNKFMLAVGVAAGTINNLP